MTAGEVFWFAAGFATGGLALAQAEVIWSWRWRRKHPMLYDIRRPGPPAEWVGE